MNCKARQRALQTGPLLRRDALLRSTCPACPRGVEESEGPRASPAAFVFPRAGPFVRSDRLPAAPSQVEGSRVHARNPFRIRTYEKCARKPPKMCTYRIIGLKPS